MEVIDRCSTPGGHSRFPLQPVPFGRGCLTSPGDSLILAGLPGIGATLSSSPPVGVGPLSEGQILAHEEKELIRAHR